MLCETVKAAQLVGQPPSDVALFCVVAYLFGLEYHAYAELHVPARVYVVSGVACTIELVYRTEIVTLGT